MENETAVVKSDYIEMMPIEQARQNYGAFAEFVKSILKKDLDFGEIPGTNKPSLYKPGAEKLRFVYGIGVEFEPIEAVVDYDKGIVDYTYRCTARSMKGQILSQCEGNCNSKEAKFGYLWKNSEDLPAGTDTATMVSRGSGKKLSEFSFAVDKAETTGNYGKPAEYWKKFTDAIETGKAKKISRKTKTGKMMDAWELDESSIQYRVPNPDIIGMKNTIMKMAQKRAFVGAILLATGASEYFTQDVEDMDLTGKGHIYSETNDMPPDQTYTDFVEVEKPAEKEEAPMVPGHWYAKLEKCKTAAAVDALGAKNKETIAANPALRTAFIARKTQIRVEAAKEEQEGHMNISENN